MKVGIITLHHVNNYGSVLQTYATQETFRHLGCETEIIDYCREDQRSYTAMMKAACHRSSYAANPLLRAAYYVVKFPSYARQKMVFDAFLKEYITTTKTKYTDYEQLKNDPPDLDAVCTGSDQMWNSEYNRGVEKAYYLAFADPGIRKLSYSTSIGMTDFPESEIDEIRSYLKQYRAISVREASAVDTLERIGVEGVRQVLDPTLVLTGEEWRKLASSEYAGRKPYVLIYQLNPSVAFDRFAKELAEKRGCDLLRINLLYDQCAKCGKAIHIPSVRDFLSLFANADCVVTDSFHGTAFCLNLNKQFYVFYPPRYSTRLESILNLTGQQSRVIGSGQPSDGNIDYRAVNAILDEERQKNIAFLKEALGI